MKKNDTALYKLKVGAVSVLLCGLFTVFAVGCSSNADNPDEPDNTLSSLSNDRNNNADPGSGSSVPKITLPAMSPTGIQTGAFNNGRPTETRPSPEGGRVTIGELEIVPFTKPDITTAPEVTAAEAEETDETRYNMENPKITFDDNRDPDATRSNVERPKITLNGDSFDIVDDTTATEVYGFNG